MNIKNVTDNMSGNPAIFPSPRDHARKADLKTGILSQVLLQRLVAEMIG